MVNLDLAVEDLQERLRAGKIYAPEKIPLGARALLQGAEPRAPARARAARGGRERRARQRAAGVAGAVRSAESAAATGSRSRVMVCLSSGRRAAASLVRKGSRLAGRLSTDWFVVFVETPEESPEQIDAEAQRHLLTNTTWRASWAPRSCACARPIRWTRSWSSRARTASATSSSAARTSRLEAVARALRAAAPGARGARARRPRRRDGRGGRARDACEASCCSPRRRWRWRWLLVGVAVGGRDHAAGRAVAPILADNYRSVLAAAADEGVAGAHRQRARLPASSATSADATARSRRNRRSVRAASSSVQEGNITEPGEAEVTRALRARLERRTSRRCDALPAARRRRRTRGRLLPPAAADVLPRSSSAPTTSWG